MTLAVVRSVGTARRLRSATELEDFEQELVDRYALAMAASGVTGRHVSQDGSLTDVRHQFGDDGADPDAPLLPSEPRDRDTGRSTRAGHDSMRSGLAAAVDRWLPAWSGRLTRTCCGTSAPPRWSAPGSGSCSASSTAPAHHTVLLAGPARVRLAAWLDYRARRWPDTANPHLFITQRSALALGPACHRWIKLKTGVPGGVQAIREDRILHEAHAGGGDLRRLCDLFGLSVSGAERYTATLDHPDLAAKAAKPAAS